jgi:hypothetical protein
MYLENFHHTVCLADVVAAVQAPQRLDETVERRIMSPNLQPALHLVLIWPLIWSMPVLE